MQHATLKGPSLISTHKSNAADLICVTGENFPEQIPVAVIRFNIYENQCLHLNDHQTILLNAIDDDGTFGKNIKVFNVCFVTSSCAERWKEVSLKKLEQRARLNVTWTVRFVLFLTQSHFRNLSVLDKYYFSLNYSYVVNDSKPIKTICNYMKVNRAVQESLGRCLLRIIIIIIDAFKIKLLYVIMIASFN